MDALARKLGMSENSLTSGPSSSDKQAAADRRSVTPAFAMDLVNPSRQAAAEKGTLGAASPVGQILNMLSQKTKPEEHSSTLKPKALEKDLQPARQRKSPVRSLAPTSTSSKTDQAKPKVVKKPEVPASNDDIIEMIRRLQKEVKRP
ncbi:hypothetical protein ElyMa_002493400 [Elysia marginata]|uniref:Shootin-1 n=1 Tax=Elysia marginata TaxID=1093978 RepID=A0AAV4GPZ6_9GAST|nr:hypothetical protein ElyMa_002493400 [Elysia marginata]